MKKYPIYYKGKKYEVRWRDLFGDVLIRVYSNIGHIFRIPMPLRYFPNDTYEPYRYSLYANSSLFYGLDKNSDNYYIKQAELAVKEAVRIQEVIESTNSIEDRKLQALKKWNSVINE